MRVFSALLFIAAASPLLAKDTRAAACCGGTSASPALISGDDAYQFGASISSAEVIGDAPEEGRPVFRGPNTDETTRVFRMDAAAILSDRTQASVTVPIVEKSIRAGETTRRSSGLGDLSAGFAYEAWPEWTYSPWKPRGFVFGQLNIPVAHSIYDSEAAGATDALGTGFYRASFGALLLKGWREWDASLVPELHYSLARTFTDSAGDSLRIAPGFGASTEASVGYHLSNFRLGLRIQPVWNQSRKVTQAGASENSSNQWVWNTGLDASYLVNPEWSLTGSYTDQTLFGPAVNTTLSRTFALNIQRRWPR